MLKNLLITTLTPLGTKREKNSWENRPFLTVWPEESREKIQDASITIKKRQKRVRTAFTTEQLRALEEVYSQGKYIDNEKRSELSKTLNLDCKCIKIWFQNRRMKEKKQLAEYNDMVTSSDSDNQNASLTTSSQSPTQIKHCQTQRKHYQTQSKHAQIRSEHWQKQLEHCQIKYSNQNYSSQIWRDCRNEMIFENNCQTPAPELQNGHKNQSVYHYNLHLNNLKSNCYDNAPILQNNTGYVASNNHLNKFYNDNNCYYTEYYPYNMNYTGNKIAVIEDDTQIEEN